MNKLDWLQAGIQEAQDMIQGVAELSDVSYMELSKAGRKAGIRKLALRFLHDAIDQEEPPFETDTQGGS